MNNRDLYKSFTKSKLIYGCSAVHVQLVAKQLNILASEVMDYILANPALVSYEVKTHASGYSNPLIGNEYAGLYIRSVTPLPWLSTSSVIKEGDDGATVVVLLEGCEFGEDKDVEDTKNWTIGGLTHGLTLDTITKDEDNQCTLTFTGTAKLGDLTIMAKKEALIANTDSDVLTVPVSAVTLDYATVQSILARLDLIEGTLDDIDSTISALDTGILARLDLIEGTLDDIDSTISAPDTGILARLDALESQE